MAPSSGPSLHHALLYFLFITVIAAAPQQQSNTLRRSPPENAALDPSKGYSGQASAGTGARISTTHRHGKDTAIVPTDERALATFAPAAESAPAVRAHPARSSAAAGALSRHSARSLQDWQVEDIILLATVDGKIHARERHSGAARWELEVDRSMVETVYHRNNVSGGEESVTEDDFLWIVEPSQDGALYIYAPGSRLGMQKLGLTVKQLVEELSPYAGEDPPVVYTAEKKNTLYTVDAATGSILKMFSSAGSVTNNERTCRRVNALETLDDDECEPIGTLTLGRTEYIVSIQDKHSGESICTISYFEWSPNIRDKDLQGQYATTLDNKYVYSKHDGSIMALEHNRDVHGARRTTSAHSLMYSHKFSSPVARVYDVVRPYDLASETEEASLVVLPQPVGPVNDQWPVTDNVFVNCTESGSWYALSEQSYPLVTDGASRALCYTDDVYMNHVSLGKGTDSARQRAKLVGLHPLSALRIDGGHRIPLIGGPEPEVPDEAIEEHLLPGQSDIISSPSDRWSILRPSPMTILLTLALLATLPPVKKYLLRVLDGLRKKTSIGHQSTVDAFLSSEEVDVVDNAVPEITIEPAVQSTIDRKVRFPEPAEETIFPQQASETLATKSDNLVEEVVTESVAELEREPTPPSAGDETPTPKPEKEKKARRGVRGGRKIKEKKLEQEQAQQRRRENSLLQKAQNEPPAELLETEAAEAKTADASAGQVISVDASESPGVHGNIQINNLVINTDRLIGRGSAGTCVFEGSFGMRDVAVKRMLSQYYELASQEVVFLQENDDHPNVIRYYCQERDHNFLYIAVELCEASLWDLFFPQLHEEGRQKHLAGILSAIQQDVSGALYQIALGLRHLHARRIIHRDIKPQNILIARPNATRKGPHLLISDFGLCKTLPENVSTLVDPTNNAGTSGWKAPELISQPKESNNNHSTLSAASDSATGTGGMGGVKRAADIFSLGCLFFWVLTSGCHPFDDREGWAQIRELNIKKNNLQNMDKLDLGDDTEEPMQLITQMLAHRPEERPSVDVILQHPFFWKPKERLAFLCDVSDHFEREPREPPSWQLELLELVGPSVIEKGDFLKSLPQSFIDTLGKQRKYTGSRMLDLLRALRNKKNHYEDMPEEVKRRVGALPAGYLQFWTTRFPKLLMACYEVVRECQLEDSERFRGYFEVKD